jgi:hypothetical protein
MFYDPRAMTRMILFLLFLLHHGGAFEVQEKDPSFERMHPEPTSPTVVLMLLFPSLLCLFVHSVT